MTRADRDRMEDEVEESIRRANAECEDEYTFRGAVTGRISCGFTTPFGADLAACAETNS